MKSEGSSNLLLLVNFLLYPINMAARNRPRGTLAKDETPDAHEERTMWNAIVNDLRKLKGIQEKATEVAKAQVDLEAKVGKCKSAS